MGKGCGVIRKWGGGSGGRREEGKHSCCRSFEAEMRWPSLREMSAEIILILGFLRQRKFLSSF